VTLFTFGSLGAIRESVAATVGGLFVLMTAAATPIIGPLTFVGLMAPHIVLGIGIRRALPALLSTAVAGASVMVTADWLARTVAIDSTHNKILSPDALKQLGFLPLSPLS
jgi:ABC-type Fe3+-siderophore transport system permease subunit